MEYEVHYDQREFGARLREIRRKNNITQEALAEKLMLSVDSISNYENGRTTCMPEHVIHLCQIFNVSADYFYFGDDKKLKQKCNDIVTKITDIISNCSDFDKDRAYQMLLLMLAKPAA